MLHTVPRGLEVTSGALVARDQQTQTSFMRHNRIPRPFCQVSSLAALKRKLGIPLTEVTTQLKELETKGRIMGVIVDSSSGGANKSSESSYVRVSLDEMRTLAAFVNERERLSVVEFTDEANKVLQLSNPCAEEKSEVGVLEGEERAVKIADGSE